MADLIGNVIANRYQVNSFLGRGGMADVYQVLDQERNAFLAMKILHSDLAEDRVLLRRFQREAQTLAKLQHPNIVRFYGLEKSDNLVYILMDYVEGTTLRKEIFQSREPLSTKRIQEVMKSVCGALYYAHKSGFVHTDIKPANIMIHNNGTILVADFGITRMTESSTVTMAGAGTPAYMSPEQINGEIPTPQMDIYALGIVLFEMLTGGERPFTGENARTTGTTSEKVRWEQVKMTAPPPSIYNKSITPNMDEIVLKCLEKNPSSRYSSTLELLNALTSLVSSGEKIQKPVVVYEEIRKDTNQTENKSFWSFLKPIFSNNRQILKKNLDNLESTDASQGLMTENLLTAIDPNRRRDLIRLIGRDQELRIKDVIVHFGGGRYLLRGYRRFGSTSLVEQIIESSKNDLSKKYASNSAIMAIRLELPSIENPEDVVLALVREFRFEATRENVSNDLRKKLDKLSQEKHVRIASSTDSQSVSLKVSPMPSLEASLSRKTDKEPQQATTKLTDEMLFEIITGFLKQPATKIGNNLEILLNRVIKNSNLPIRIVVVIDKIESPKVFYLLRQLRLFDNKSISVFAFVRQEIYNQWSAQIREEIINLGFSDHYVPSLWEDQSHFVETMLRESFLFLPENSKLMEFRDHIAFITRGAPGDVVKTILSHEYSEYRSGIPTLNLENIRDWEVVQYNALRHRLLENKWAQILESQYIGKEECDQARMGVYEIMDWIDKIGGFYFRDASSYADTAKIKISESKIRRDRTLRILLGILTSASYLRIIEDEQFIVNRQVQIPESSPRVTIKSTEIFCPIHGPFDKSLGSCPFPHQNTN